MLGAPPFVSSSLRAGSNQVAGSNSHGCTIGIMTGAEEEARDIDSASSAFMGKVRSETRMAGNSLELNATTKG